jgi:hypothetical protein
MDDAGLLRDPYADKSRADPSGIDPAGHGDAMLR